MARILIVDDDPGVCRSLCSALTRLDHRTSAAASLSEGLAAAESGRFEVVLLDVYLPDGSGLEAVQRFRECPSSPEVIIITGRGEPDGAEMAIRSGAWDYLPKPPSIRSLVLPLNRALAYGRQKKAARRILDREGIVGRCRRVRSCLEQVASAAGCDLPVLICGETGTGKELFARAIHQNSARHGADFVVVDCAALPENLVESILFGHVRGAFTGAAGTQPGLVCQADGGTLFLDEIGELPKAAQKTFLRVLQEKRCRPVGGRSEVESRFRLISATHRNLEEMVASGDFRKDLLYRIRAMSLELPPLRSRTGDVRELAVHFLDRICKRYGIDAKAIAADCAGALEAYPWPGNVRELIHCLESAVAEAGDAPLLTPEHLPTEIRVFRARAAAGGRVCTETEAAGPAEDIPTFRDFRNEAVARAENSYLLRLMRAVGGDVQQACLRSGLSRARLYALLKKHRIARASFSRCRN